VNFLNFKLLIRIQQRDKMNQRKEEMKLKKQAEINMKAEAYRSKYIILIYIYINCLNISSNNIIN